MSNITDFLRTTGGAYRTYTYESSGSYTPQFDQMAIVTVVGGGGSGAISTYYANTTGRSLAQGGGSGAIAVSKLTLRAATTYTVTVGAGGVGPSTTASALVATPGNTGSASSFTGADITTMQANGAAGGGVVATTSTGAFSVNLRTAATATGGNISNILGGLAGPITSVSLSCTFLAATGGAALNLYDITATDVRSGSSNLASTASTGTTHLASTGGGGIGGASGSITIDSGLGSGTSGGGGTGGASTGESATSAGGSGLILRDKEVLSSFRVTGVGGASSSGGSGGAGGEGAGGGSSWHYSAGTNTGGAGGYYGGGGGSGNYYNGGDPKGGAGGFGAGGGGAAAKTGTSQLAGGSGGDGFVIIEIVGVL